MCFGQEILIGCAHVLFGVRTAMLSRRLIPAAKEAVGTKNQKNRNRKGEPKTRLLILQKKTIPSKTSKLNRFSGDR